MKKLSDFLAEGPEPRNAPDENRFRKKHVVQDTPYPAKGTDDVLNARNMKKDDSKLTHKSPEEEAAMYEEEDIDAILDEIIEEELNSIESAWDAVETVHETREPMMVSFEDGVEFEIDVATADAMVSVVEALEDNNAARFLDIIEEEEGFHRMKAFALRWLVDD